MRKMELSILRQQSVESRRRKADGTNSIDGRLRENGGRPCREDPDRRVHDDVLFIFRKLVELKSSGVCCFGSGMRPLQSAQGRGKRAIQWKAPACHCTTGDASLFAQ